MATFAYEAMNSVGQAVKGEVDATGKDEAVAKIRAMGNFPTKVREKAAPSKSPRSKAGQRDAPAPTTARRRAAGRVRVKQLTTFTRQLSTLQDAGLPILRSLRILEQQQKPGSLRTALKYVAEDVESGATLSEAMAKHPKAFDRLYTNMVQAGEAGGVLDIILQRLADFMERAQELRRKVIGAMIYPVAVISFAVLIVTGIMYFVIPRFELIFQDFGTELPGPTLALLAISRWVTAGGWIVIIASPIVFVLVAKLIRQSQSGRYLMDSLKMNIPVMGQIVSKSSISRFSRTLGTLLAAGVPILEALNITRDTCGNEVYAKAMGQVHDAIREGESFAGPLRQARVVDAMVVNMIDVGEETGDLDKMLMKIADNYDDEVATLVDALVSLLEPVMVIVLGVIVGFIVIALFLPLVKLITNLTG
ncbi:MAG: type II secretion system F family protein [Planctomycetota bacterium]